jgi:hypothetical protein
MEPQFPGMNPYLENPELWSEVHSWLIVQLARFLNPLIAPKYRAAVEKRVYSDSLLVGIPDVSVFQPKAVSSETQGRTVSVLNQPLKVTVPVTEEVRESYLEIREVGTGTVVTVVEVLSPKNKLPGEGKSKYDAKRQKILNSATHLVEIDLLRTGKAKLVAGGVESDYRILVSRADCRPEAELYAFNLKEPIPQFRLPLREGDEEPVVCLQELLEQVYQEAALALAIDYSKQPVPPVSEADFAWVQTLFA